MCQLNYQFGVNEIKAERVQASNIETEKLIAIFVCMSQNTWQGTRNKKYGIRRLSRRVTDLESQRASRGDLYSSVVAVRHTAIVTNGLVHETRKIFLRKGCQSRLCKAWSGNHEISASSFKSRRTYIRRQARSNVTEYDECDCRFKRGASACHEATCKA